MTRRATNDDPDAPVENGAELGAEKRRPPSGGLGQCSPPIGAADCRRLSPLDVVVFGLLVVFFVDLSRRPLWHTDLWGHLAYGRLIVSQGAIPSTEPLMVLARGVPFRDSAWLSQVIGYAAYRWRGPAAVQFLYSAAITSSLAILACGVRRRTGRAWPALLAVLACTWVEWQAFLIVRPQLAGLVCFVLLLVYLAWGRPGAARWIIVPATFAAWANLHGSFVVGLGLLAALTAGRAADVLIRTGRLSRAVRDARFRRLAWLMPAAVAATLINPYGAGIYGAVRDAAASPNLLDIVEWRPLTVSMRQGQAAFATALALAACYRLTRRRASVAEALLLFGLGAAALWRSRMVVWWAPVATYYLGVQASSIRFRLRHRTTHDGRREATARRMKAAPRGGDPRCDNPRWRPAWVVAAVGVGALAFCLTPLGRALGGRGEFEREASLSARTPIAATDYLREHPPRGQIFNTYEWGDYLLWAGPPGLEVFVASHAHLVPVSVWRDYMHVIEVRPGWSEILSRYSADTAILDRYQHVRLVEALADDRHWTVAFEDDRSIVFVRKPTAEPPRVSGRG